MCIRDRAGTLAPSTPQVIDIDQTTFTPGITAAIAAANSMNVWTSDGQILPEDDVIVISAPAANFSNFLDGPVSPENTITLSLVVNRNP